MESAKDRIIGIDIAKIVAMIFVVGVHVNGFGLPYTGASEPGLGYQLIRKLLGALFMSCINIFALASGYIGVLMRFNLSRIVRLWLQVVFTGLMVVVAIDVFTDIPITPFKYFRACIPIAKNEYWYMTAYFMLCFVMPLVNSGIKALEEKELRRGVILLIGIICGESFICSANALGVAHGYSFAWLFVLYIVGAYIRLYRPFCGCRIHFLGIAVVCAMVAGWCPLLLEKMQMISYWKSSEILKFSGYTSPFTVVISICIFLSCLEIGVPFSWARKIIVTLSETTTGVYLIHVQPLFFGNIFRREIQKFGVSSVGEYLFKLAVVTMVVYIACTALDYIRLSLFRVVERIARSFRKIYN